MESKRNLKQKQTTSQRARKSIWATRNEKPKRATEAEKFLMEINLYPLPGRCLRYQKFL